MTDKEKIKDLMREWCNWQPRQTQNLLSERTWGFESPFPHQFKTSGELRHDTTTYACVGIFICIFILDIFRN